MRIEIALLATSSPLIRSFFALPSLGHHLSYPDTSKTRRLEGSDGDNDDASEPDWREFRARLVMQEKDEAHQSLQQSLPQQWAYESGTLVEAGSIILSKEKPDFGFGLRQQYFHKSAILVLSHDKEFTRGIILNRPSDFKIGKWQIWFGGPAGEVQGMDKDDTEITCLHSLPFDDKKSFTVTKEIKYTAFSNAKDLVEGGKAVPSDFFCFAGYCGWERGQLLQELAKGSWIMVTTDSQTVIHQLKKRSSGLDPRGAGLDTWIQLAQRIGKDIKISDSSQSFDDLMLKEWARRNLCGGTSVEDVTTSFSPEAQSGTSIISADSDRTENMIPGTLLRESCRQNSPFLLSDQDMHKCLLLVTSDDSEMTTAVYLNHPTARVVDLPVKVVGTDITVPVPFVQRYGGKYKINGEGERPILWLHCSPRLREAGVGIPFSSEANDIWECSAQDVASAIGRGLATPKDFMAISGGCIWEKSGGGLIGGLQGLVWEGKFECVSSQRTQDIWDKLQFQELLGTINVKSSIDISNEAWVMAAADPNSDEPNAASEIVFESNVSTSVLADHANRRWVSKYILGAPSLFREETVG